MLLIFVICNVVEGPTYISLANSSGISAHKIDNLFELTDSERAFIAKTYDLLITGDWNNVFFPELHAVNPDLAIYLYRSISNINEGYESEIKVARANGWILLDADGNEVYRPGNPNLKFIDIGNPAYREWVSNILVEWTANKHVTGIFGDNTAVTWKGHTSAPPINPRTKLVYSDEDYAADMAALVRRVKEKTGKLYIGNGKGMVCGSHYAGYYMNKQLSDMIINEVDGVLLEGFIRFYDTVDWRSADEWLEDLSFLDMLNRRGITTLSWAITYGQLPPGSTREDIATYGYTTYLLAKREGAYFIPRGYENAFLSVMNIDVGEPVTSYRSIDGGLIYERLFSKSLVLVNPSYEAYTYNLNGDYTTLEGEVVSKIELPPHTGVILIGAPKPNDDPAPISTSSSLAVKWIRVRGPDGYEDIDPGGTVTRGSMVRIKTGVGDDTVASDLTVTIGYRPKGGSWTTATPTDHVGGFWYYDWYIPMNAVLGLYDVRITVSGPDGGYSEKTETGEFKVVA